jgi:hypothetical protein
MRIVKLFDSSQEPLHLRVVFNKIKLYRPEEAPDFKWRNLSRALYSRTENK